MIKLFIHHASLSTKQIVSFCQQLHLVSLNLNLQKTIYSKIKRFNLRWQVRVLTQVSTKENQIKETKLKIDPKLNGHKWLLPPVIVRSNSNNQQDRLS